MPLIPPCAFLHLFISTIICCWNCSMIHVVFVFYPYPCLFKLFSMLNNYPILADHFLTTSEHFVFSCVSLLHICCSHHECSSVCQWSFTMPFMIIHLCFSHHLSPCSRLSFICACQLVCSHSCLCLQLFHLCSSCYQCSLFY